MAIESYIRTSHGVLAIEESGQGDLPVVLIHGNSSSREVFRRQIETGLFKDYRLIAVDLPVTAGPKMPLMLIGPTRFLAWRELSPNYSKVFMYQSPWLSVGLLAAISPSRCFRS